MKTRHRPSALCRMMRSGSPASHIAFRGRGCVRGFTLTELMVAVAITALLILTVNQVFSTVSKAVRSGIGASEVIQNSRIIGEQMQQDFGAMIGPDLGGVLVIVNKKLTDVQLLRGDDLNEDGAWTAGENKSDVRDDQLMFIRSATLTHQIEPLCPRDANSYSGASSASEAKVWYGHGLRTLPDGSKPSAGNGDTLGGDLNLTDANPEQPANHFAGEWILTRQALFLDAGTTGSVFAQGGMNDVVVSGSAAPAAHLYSSVTDIAKFGLTIEEASYGCMVGGNDDGTVTTNSATRLWSSSSSGDSAGATKYADRAYNYLYLPPTKRLLVNPKSDTTTFAPWQIAQMTPYLVGHVSDFIVEFAGDYATNPCSATPTGPADGKLDRYLDGSIVWYGLNVVPPSSNTPLAGTAVAPAMFINKSQSSIQDNPIFDSQSSSTTDHRYVFRHKISSSNKYETNWPTMIRIRYRLIDSKGQVSGADGAPGRWFEQMMTVNR